MSVRKGMKIDTKTSVLLEKETTTSLKLKPEAAVCMKNCLQISFLWINKLSSTKKLSVDNLNTWEVKN